MRPRQRLDFDNGVPDAVVCEVVLQRRKQGRLAGARWPCKKEYKQCRVKRMRRSRDEVRVVELVLVDEHVGVRARCRHKVGVADDLSDARPR